MLMEGMLMDGLVLEGWSERVFGLLRLRVLWRRAQAP